MTSTARVIIVGLIITALVPLGMASSGILIIPDPDRYSDKALKSLLYGDMPINNDANTVPVAPANTVPVAPANTVPVAPANTVPVAPANTVPVNSSIDDVKTDTSSTPSKFFYYSIDPIPSISNKSIPINALKKSILTWEKYNPELKFIESDNANIEIRWQLNPSTTHIGLATCESDIRGTILHCFVDISIGGTSCSGEYFQTRENDLSNVIMHELGHVLGLEHTLEKNHLMYSTEFIQDPFDTLGYSIPDKFPDLNSRTDHMQEIINMKLDKIDKENTAINVEQTDYDLLLEEYERFGSVVSQEDFPKVQEIKDRLDTWIERINGMIHENNVHVENVNALIGERNMLVEEINAGSNEKTCN